MPRLILIKGADEGRQFELTKPVHAVGRDSASGIRLHDTEVSRRHAEFRLVNGTYHVVDVGSANGTFVNGQLIADAPLHAGDRVQIGQSVLVFSTGAAPAAAGDLADRISMITRHDMELSSAIVKTIGESEGSRILAQPDQVQRPWLKSALANLSVMYEASQAISHILDVNKLLERLMALIFGSIQADRGCVMLRRDETGVLEPKAVLWRDGGANERMTVSSTIVDYVLRERKGVLISDAASDERFAGGHSILRFGIREVICVPMKGRHETLGVLYVDTVCSARELVESAGPTGKFTEDHLALAIAIAHQAALAVEETRYHQAMVQAERLAAIGQTIAALSHHIKNILQGLRSGGDILNMGLAEKDEVLMQKGWRIVQKNQGKISDLVMDMLSYSKEREPAVEMTDLNALTREVLEVVEGRARERGTRLEASYQPLPKVQADPQGLHHALLNVVSNALDAVEDRPDARVTVTTSPDPDDGWACVVVHDNGPGIPAEKVDDIFKPFVSTKGAKGTGLGLPVSRKILREHGGDILVQTQLGKGSRFLLRLPLKSPLGHENHATVRDLPPVRPPDE